MFAKFKFIFLILAIISLVNLSACSVFKKKDNKQNSGKNNSSIFQDTPEKMYNRANRQLSAGRYEDALEEYNNFIIQFPFGYLSETARLERIFILNKLNLTEEATESVEQFIRQYPLHQNIDYAYFMRGVITFEKKATGIFGKLRGANEVSRNNHFMQKSYKAFDELINKYPNSTYAADARQRMTYLRNKMAEHELEVAKFYADRNANIGAINRCQYIIENYQEAPAVIDALRLMVVTYQKMGLIDQAKKTQTVLDKNYTNIAGVNDSREPNKASIWSKLPNLNPFKKKNKKQDVGQEITQTQTVETNPAPTQNKAKVSEETKSAKKSKQKSNSLWKRLMNISLAK